jgi:DNA-directed RNA polymerase
LKEAIAERFKGAPFYVPLNCDFRGRVFPIPHFNHYRGDHIRSLFKFHDGMRLGNNEKYLMDHTATRGGFEGVDKKSLHDRRKWCDDNWDLIERTAKLESEEWTKAENPFGFLAACKELVEARAAGADYITHLPIEVDASCSVLQHYCLMLRSEKARLVNLGACATASAPEDNYGNTVQLVVAGVAEDPELEAALRDVSLDRKAMKRPQMTDGYNSTTYGKAQQFESEFADRGQMVEWKYLRGLAEVTEDVIAKHFREVQEAKDFLRRCAEVLADRGLSLQWTTPSGWPWANRYNKLKTKRIRSLFSGICVQTRIGDGYEPGIRTKKAKNAAAPNVVHALDAAHLVLIVNACAADDIKNIMTVHDCFCFLAPQANQGKEVFRQELKRMYEEHDPLTEMRESVLRLLATSTAPRKGRRVAKALGVAAAADLLGKEPERGPFDLEEILSAVYAVH